MSGVEDHERVIDSEKAASLDWRDWCDWLRDNRPKVGVMMMRTDRFQEALPALEGCVKITHTRCLRHS